MLDKLFDVDFCRRHLPRLGNTDKRLVIRLAIMFEIQDLKYLVNPFREVAGKKMDEGAKCLFMFFKVVQKEVSTMYPRMSFNTYSNVLILIKNLYFYSTA